MISLSYRPGHFIMQGHPVADRVAARRRRPGQRGARARAHHRPVPDPHPGRLVRRSTSSWRSRIRALSPAVNDTFTALTCIDWLGDSLCKIVRHWHPARVHRDEPGIRPGHRGPAGLRAAGAARVREDPPGGPGHARRHDPPARGAGEDHEETPDAGQRRVLLEQAEMIQRASERSVPEASDRADVRRRLRGRADGRGRARLPLSCLTAGSAQAQCSRPASCRRRTGGSPPVPRGNQVFSQVTRRGRSFRRPAKHTCESGRTRMRVWPPPKAR